MKLKQMTPDQRTRHIVNALKSYWGYDTREAEAVLAVHDANTLIDVHREVVATSMQPGPYRRGRSNLKWREGLMDAVSVLFSRQMRLMAMFDQAQRDQTAQAGQDEQLRQEIQESYEQALKNATRL